MEIKKKFNLNGSVSDNSDFDAGGCCRIEKRWDINWRMIYLDDNDGFSIRKSN